MTVSEARQHLGEVTERLALARDRRRAAVEVGEWSAVAACDAEVNHLAGEMEHARLALADAEREAASAARLADIEALRVEAQTVNGAWASWLCDVASAEAYAGKLWGVYREMQGQASQIARRAAALGCDVAVNVGQLSGAALAARRGTGALQWKG